MGSSSIAGVQLRTFSLLCLGTEALAQMSFGSWPHFWHFPLTVYVLMEVQSWDHGTISYSAEAHLTLSMDPEMSEVSQDSLASKFLGGETFPSTSHSPLPKFFPSPLKAISLGNLIDFIG